jgi:UDP-N-acetylmuramate dehydrogenase
MVVDVLHLLSDHTTLRLGGPAGAWIEANGEQELIDSVQTAGRDELFLLGGGSNVVAADKGVSGWVVHVTSTGIERRQLMDSVRLDVQAGEHWDELVALAVEERLAGIECLSGIPGTVGATPIQNVGAYGQSLGDRLCAVRVYDRRLGEVFELGANECSFGYRTSRFKREAGRFVILSVGLTLKCQDHSLPILHEELAKRLGVPLGASVPLPQAREAVLELRREKGMVLDASDPDTRSTGSFFVNPLLSPRQFKSLGQRIASRGLDQVPHWDSEAGLVKVSAAWLIEGADFRKGHGNPTGIAISTKHALALTNRGKGTTDELVSLAQRIAAKVRDMWGVTLLPEPEFLGHEWQAADG